MPVKLGHLLDSPSHCGIPKRALPQSAKLAKAKATPFAGSASFAGEGFGRAPSLSEELR